MISIHGVGMLKLTTSLMLLNPQGSAQGNYMGNVVGLQQHGFIDPLIAP
jgi:hypothetical protein